MNLTTSSQIQSGGRTRKPRIERLMTIIMTVVFITWMTVWAAIQQKEILSQESLFYRKIFKGSLNDGRQTTGINNYYSVLTSCEKLLAEGEQLKLVLPKTPLMVYNVLRDKGRYFLYPRNYGDNDRPADCILVFGVSDYPSPEGFKKIAVFYEDTYLLGNLHCTISKTNGEEH